MSWNEISVPETAQIYDLPFPAAHIFTVHLACVSTLYSLRHTFNIFLVFFSRLVHAITPLEENKSFLEKVKLGEQLCGISSMSESLLSTSSWGSNCSTAEVTAKKSAENLHQQKRICKGTIPLLGSACIWILNLLAFVQNNFVLIIENFSDRNC